MDPLAAFSLGGTVLAFIQFASSLISGGRELYRSQHGTLTANEELELATADFRALLVKLRKGYHPAIIGNAPAEQVEDYGDTFQRVLHDAEQVAKELIERLEKLKIRGKNRRRWESVHKAIRSAWTKDERRGKRILLSVPVLRPSISPSPPARSRPE